MTDTSDKFDPQLAAAMLAAAWTGGALLTELPTTIRPRTLAQGYDVQDRMIAALAEKTVGWKLGVGSTIQKRQSGIGRSLAGRIVGSRVYRPGDTIPLPNAAPVTVEFEIAYVLGRDVLPDEAPFPVLEAVAETRATFELVRSRFVDRRAVGWPSFAADNSAFQALVLGETVELASIPELVRTLVVMTDQKDSARSLSGEDATDPVAALSDLITMARERGMVLPKGSIISTGTVSRPFDVGAGAHAISARFLDRELGFRTSAPQAA